MIALGRKEFLGTLFRQVPTVSAAPGALTNKKREDHHPCSKAHMPPHDKIGRSRTGHLWCSAASHL